MNFTTENQLRAEIARVWSLLNAERSGSKWQPIETAPKDGKRIMVFDPTIGNGFTSFCRFWNSSWWEGNLATSRELFPTHWMPLPAPPAGA